MLTLLAIFLIVVLLLYLIGLLPMDQRLLLALQLAIIIVAIIAIAHIGGIG